jgi:hypothetical protein
MARAHTASISGSLRWSEFGDVGWGGLALVVLTVQRAARSFWRSFTGLACQASGTRPALIACFSARVLRCLGAATMLASISCPDIAR